METESDDFFEESPKPFSESHQLYMTASFGTDSDAHDAHGSLDRTLSQWMGEDFDSERLEEIQKNRADGSDMKTIWFSRVSRVEQLETWDCGIVCIMIILRWIKQHDDISSHVMSDEEWEQYDSLRNSIQTQSVWTADLVLQLQTLLPSYECRYLFCSKTFQVEQAHRDVHYYQDTFHDDEMRVTYIFRKLSQESENSMLCVPGGMKLELILCATRHPTCIAMVLVDNNLLQRKEWEGHSTTTNYIGHYVILCGISHDPDHIATARDLDGYHSDDASLNGQDNSFCLVLCDPGPGRPSLSYVTMHRFDCSRTAQGTDEDIIFIRKG